VKNAVSASEEKLAIEELEELLTQGKEFPFRSERMNHLEMMV
jgi:hypothetical protein